MKRHAIALLLFLTGFSAASAEVRIEHMTWVEVRDALKAGNTTIIIPTGGTEQNGPHMVLGKHNFIVAETARRIAERLGNALVAPVLAYVPEGDIENRQGNMAFPGTISLPEPVYESVLEAAADSFKAHGFQTIVFLGDSGGNQRVQDRLAKRLTADWKAWFGTSPRVFNAENYYAEYGGDAFLIAEGETPGTVGTHAGIRDTSELMAVYPGGVRLNAVTSEAGNGNNGRPERSSKARGEALLELKIKAAVSEIRAFQSK